VPYLLPASRIGLRIEGHGPPIVLLHSSMSSKSQWRELIESLRDRYRLIAIDLLGYGESAMPGDGYRLRDEVSLVESVLAHELQPGEQFHLIGHSYGGIVALQLAAQQHTHRIRSLSLFEPIAFHLLPDRDPDRAELEAARREISDRLDAGDAHGGAACFVDCWSGAGAFAQLREERQAVLASQVPKVLLEYRAVADEARNAAAYRRIDVPTCLVSGRWSPEVARRLTTIFSEILPHASCFEVAAGHMAPITHPALVNPIFEQFVRAVDSGERRRAAPSGSWLAPFRAAAFGLLAAAITVLPLFAMLVAVGNERFLSETIDPTLGKESPKMVVNGRVADNTLQQFVCFLVGITVVAVSVPIAWLSIIPALAITFVICRIVFWIGYRIHPLYRAPGFSSTAYMNLFMYIGVLWLRLA